MAIKIKLEDLNIINNKINLNKKTFHIEKINKIIVRGFLHITSDIPTSLITSNQLFLIDNILATIEFYRKLNIYFTLQDILYSNIHNPDIINSFANNIYNTDDGTIYINMPFYMNNCYYVQSIPQEVQILKNGIYVHNFLTIKSILYLYNPLLYRIINLIKIITSSFFLYEYMSTEYIEFPYINTKNLYFNDIIQFIEYCSIININIENINIYKECYNKNINEIFQILSNYFNLQNTSFNLPNNIDVLHYNYWFENIYIDREMDNINCSNYQILQNNTQQKIQTYQPIVVRNNRYTYINHINYLLNNINTLHTIYKSNILSYWQHDNLNIIWSQLKFINNKIYYKDKLCYLTLCNIEKNTLVYNLDSGLFI